MDRKRSGGVFSDAYVDDGKGPKCFGFKGKGANTHLVQDQLTKLTSTCHNFKQVKL